jgi:AcrR family transcriptional regulator
MTRKRDEAGVRRAQILDQAIRAIGERGYHGFTIPELAQRCELSNAGLLHHFPSKDDLLIAVLREIEARETEILLPLVEAASKSEQDGQSRRAVLEVLRTMVVRATTQPALGRLFAELQVESLSKTHPAYAWWQRRDAGLLSLFTKLVGPYVADPRSTALQLAAMFDGIFLRWLRAHQAFDAVAEWERALAKLVPQLSRRVPDRRSRPAGVKPKRNSITKRRTPMYRANKAYAIAALVLGSVLSLYGPVSRAQPTAPVSQGASDAAGSEPSEGKIEAHRRPCRPLLHICRLR